ncbi:putative RPO31-DNA-directed RNA polymerase III, 160 kd subunit [Serendipita vermifera]|nr:putative RPO31-DNA-directed RNA polymerase III, 160 kd subunit [Serendipita vermifera]
MKEVVQHTHPKVIKQLQFSLLSSQDIVKLAEFEVTHRDLYTYPDRLPSQNGVLDRRLGTTEKGAFCETCGLSAVECVGHFAYMKLALPVFHIGYFRHILTVLQCICKTCARVMVPETIRRSFLQRFRKPNLENLVRQNLCKQVVAAARKINVCQYCGATNGTVKKAAALKIVHERYRQRKLTEEADNWRQSFSNAIKFQPDIDRILGTKGTEELNPLKVLELFKKMTAEDCELVGMKPFHSRPEHYLWQYIAVPPVAIRPSVSQDGASNEDDLTTKLSEIAFGNSLIRQSLNKGINTSTLMEQWEFVQYSVALYINSDAPGIQQPNTKPLRGFCQRLKGKQGRFRGNLSGKRVDFSGRTVISPDPNLRIDEVAVPEKVARILTYPSRVTVHNIDQMRRAVRNGPDVHPGANYVQTGLNGFKKFLKYGNREETANKLRIGDVVERHLIDGDIVLFNRQPSLHRLSIMCHRAKIRPWRTFRLNECVCGPYNADFDGDEMNLHVPQTEESRTEALQLMNVKLNLVTPKNGEPIIAATQDFITAAFLLSRKDRFYDRKQFEQICAFMGDAQIRIDLPPPTILKPVQLWTGKQIFSVLMRPNRSFGCLVNVETKCQTYQAPKPRQYGDFEPLPDLSPNDGWLVVINSEIMCGVMDKSTIGSGKKKSIFGVILRDHGPDEAAAAMNRLAKLCARWLTNFGMSLGINDVIPGRNLRSQKEGKVEAAYRDCQDLIAKAKMGKLDNKPGCNQEQTLEAMISDVLSKVRGDVGSICMQELSRHNAPLIMATCGSKGSTVNVSQMVACVGQQIIAGHRVPDGFQDRSLPHFHKKSKDPPSKGFVRNSFYSGLTPTEFVFHAISGREGLVDTAVKTAETGYMQRRLMKALEDLTTHYDFSVRNSAGGIVQFTYGDDGLDPVSLEGDAQPLDLARCWLHAESISRRQGVGLTPLELQEMSRAELDSPEFAAECPAVYRDAIRAFVGGISDRLSTITEKHQLLTTESRGQQQIIGTHGQLPADIIAINNKCKVTKLQLKKFLFLCRERYSRAKVEPGSTVGAVGAQSIGEPGTQMTLKTFHFAGVASMNVTLGVPRIKEIINASKTINTPIITTKLVASESEQAARIVKGRLEKTFLGDIASVIEEAWSTDGVFLGIHIDAQAISKLQLELSLDDVKWAIVNSRKLKIKESDISVHYGKQRLRIEIKGGNEEKFYLLKALKRSLPSVIVKGIPTVHRAIINIKEKDDSRGKKGHKELIVEGNGLQQVMTTLGIVGEHTISNHIIEVEKVLGIEAARRTIINEIQYTMSQHGMYIDPRHIMLLGDVMTYKGQVLGITRFGVSKMKDSVLMLASFEKTTDHLFDASAFGKNDAVLGVSESIILGNPATSCGTSMPGLVSIAANVSAKRKLIFESAL